MTTATASATDREVWIGMHTEKGIRVYSPTSTRQFYFVSGDREYPACTCEEFQAEEPGFRCPHILAVESQLPEPPTDEDGNPVHQTQGTEEPANAVPKTPGNNILGGEVPALMVLKRSLSPDGRIDSLSVEISSAISGLSSNEIAAKARKALVIQEEIVSGFRKSNRPEAKPQVRNGKANGRAKANGSEGAIPARLVNIAGMQTRRGWSLYINVEANGETYKLFGNRRELGEQLTVAGYASLGRNVTNGVKLNVPCQVITTQNGSYTNVERLLPAEDSNGNGAEAGNGHDDIPF